MPERTATDANRELIRRFWDDLYRKDFDACGAYFADDGVYTDVPVGEQGATGPVEVAARLRLGLEPITGYAHILRNLVADGDVVITEHVEEWTWHTGEHVALPFVSVMELRDGKITRWWDYFNLPTLLDTAPQWWLDHIAQGYR
jgi:limonene-1,2-epoxide hydrolase